MYINWPATTEANSVAPDATIHHDSSSNSKYKFSKKNLYSFLLVFHAVITIIYLSHPVTDAGQKELVASDDGMRVEQMSFATPAKVPHLRQANFSLLESTTKMCASAEMKYLSTYPEVEEIVGVGGNFSSGFDHWMKLGMSSGWKYECNLAKSPRQFWINAIGIGEGIGAWHKIVSNLLFLAKELSATVVEPCMGGGRLGSCGDKRNHLPVSQVLDLSWAFRSSDDRPPLMASYKDYQQQLQQFKGKRTDHTLCLHVSGHNDKKNENIKRKFGCVLDRPSLIKDILDTEQLTNIDMHGFWRDGTEILHGMLKIPLPDTPPLPMLSFHPDHWHTVQHILQSANISNGDFSLIHWRAEKKGGMDLMECAKAVLDTRKVIEKTDSITDGDGDPHPFLLMTSLNEDPGKSLFFVPSFFHAT